MKVGSMKTESLQGSENTSSVLIHILSQISSWYSGRGREARKDSLNKFFTAANVLCSCPALKHCTIILSGLWNGTTGLSSLPGQTRFTLHPAFSWEAISSICPGTGCWARVSLFHPSWHQIHLLTISLLTISGMHPCPLPSLWWCPGLSLHPLTDVTAWSLISL